jgi:hypothetical protein
MKIFDDSFRTKPNQANPFPFTLRFPECAPKNAVASWDSDGRFSYKEGDALPPSWSHSYHGFANRYEAFVEYRVGVQVAMPQLQIIIAKPEKYDEPLVYYDRAKLPSPLNKKPITSRDVESVKNEFLLPEADRPTGFRAKAKAAFSSDYYPTYAFDWTLTAPQHLYVGQPFALEVAIRPRESNTAVLVPEVSLSSVYVSIIAIVNARADRQIFTSPEAHSNEEKINIRAVMADTGPFGKGNDWTKTLNTRELRGLCTSFTTPNISVSYRMKIRGIFSFANKTKDFDREFSVTIHPPLERSDGQASSSAAAAGSSSQAYGMESLEAALPEYDRPPEYDEAVNESSDGEVVDTTEQKRPLGVEGNEESTKSRLH